VIPVTGWELVEACIGRIGSSTDEPHEGILVDGGFAGRMPGRLDVPGVEVVTVPGAGSVAEAANTGIEAAAGEYVCLLDDDARPMEGWLGEMLGALAVAGTALVGPRTSASPGPQVLPEPPLFEDPEDAAGWSRTWTSGRQGESWPVSRLDRFCLLARRDLLVDLGGLAADERDPTGDLCDRVRGSGGGLRVADGAVVLRLEGGRTHPGSDGPARCMSHREGGDLPPGLVSVLVLSDGRPRAARTTASSAAPIADRIRVAERTGLPLTELAVCELADDVVGIDWQAEGGVDAALEGIADRHVLVCLAGERVVFDDWGRVRARLEALDAGPIEVAGDGGAEVRIHPPDAEGAAQVGGRSGVRLDGLRIAR
jgi:hypothetical protein